MAFRIQNRPGPWCKLTFRCVFLLAFTILNAEQLPIKLYTTADGLPSNHIYCIVRDSHGFLWFCTAEGLSRFDGYTFTNYGEDQGLPDRVVTDFLETRDGEYWVATATAISRFNPRWSYAKTSELRGTARQRAFEVCRLGQRGDEWLVIQIAEAPDGRIWCLTRSGLFLFDRSRKNFEPIDVGERYLFDVLLQDTDASLWIGAEGVLIHRWPDGRVDRYGEAEGLHGTKGRLLRIYSIFRDRERRLWVATWNGLYRMASHPEPGKRSVERLYTKRDGLRGGTAGTLFESRDGKLWLSSGGLAEFMPGSGGRRDAFRTLNAQQGLDTRFNVIGEDESGNLWLAGAGARRLARASFTTFTTQDGLKSNSIGSILEDREGRLIVVTGDPRFRYFHTFDGERFSPVLPRWPKGREQFTWGRGQIHFQDHTGVWWVATDRGLCQYPRGMRVEDLAHTLPERVFTERDGLSGREIYALYEDSRADVWISVIGANDVERWSRARGVIEKFNSGDDGRPLGTPTCFAEDRAGNIWMGFFWHDLARYRHGHFQVFGKAEWLTAGVVSGLFIDHAGRLWIGTSMGGLVRVDQPDLDRPIFKLYTTNSGLSSNGIRCITEDSHGRMYIGTGRGIDQLNPESGRVRHYTEADGLQFPGGTEAAYCDRHGILWFGAGGVVRFLPTPEDESPPPPAIRIKRLSLRGRPLPVSELGENHIEGLRFRPAENQLQIDFSSRSFGIGETIRYQYKLEGSDPDWGPLVDSRSVTYASLSPGSYRFLVRAVNAAGLASKSPASVMFVILPPVWQRWWFLALAFTVILLAVWGAHRYRLRQVLELERVRTRIATDLHDDIGSSLTQIAIMSEVTRQRSADPQMMEPLGKIADLSRDLVDSMSEIVWAINPKRDHLRDLTQRMRRFASEVLTTRNIELAFHVGPETPDAAVGADVRRQVFLIFKESIHNIASHSNPKRVDVDLWLEGPELFLKVADDGRGFDFEAISTGGDSSGHGLASMQERAQKLGGSFQVISHPGAGACVILRVPISDGHVRARNTYLNK